MATPNTVCRLSLARRGKKANCSTSTAWSRSSASAPKAARPSLQPKDCATALGFARELLTAFQAKAAAGGANGRTSSWGGKYKVLDHLGAVRDGHGCCYASIGTCAARVAVKILPPEQNLTPGSLQRFVREGAGGRPTRSPEHRARAPRTSIATPVSISIVLEFVDGVSLQHFAWCSRAPLPAAGGGPSIIFAKAASRLATTLTRPNLVPSRHQAFQFYCSIGWGIVKILDLGLARFCQSDDQPDSDARFRRRCWARPTTWAHGAGS